MEFLGKTRQKQKSRGSQFIKTISRRSRIES